METNLETIYSKLQMIKADLLKMNLRKSGFNKFNNFRYYELADFLPAIIQLCNKYKVCTQISFTDDVATLTAINAEHCMEQVSVTSPVRKLTITSNDGKSKMNELQGLGAEETYQRRYLYMNMFDIIESDTFDATVGQDQNSYTQNTQVDQSVQQQDNQQQSNNESIQLQLEDGSTVTYVKKFSKKNNSYFWMTNDERAKRFISEKEMQQILEGQQ